MKETLKLILMNLGLIIVNALISFLVCLIGIGFNALVFAKLPTFTIWAIVFVVITIGLEVFFYVSEIRLFKQKKTRLRELQKEGERIIEKKKAERAKKYQEELDKRETKEENKHSND